jgi:signal transduction histidine kinase
MVVVAITYLTVVLASTIYPLTSPTRDYISQLDPAVQTVHNVTGIVWLGALLGAMARQPRGPLWKLIFAYVLADRLFVLHYVPNSLVYSVALSVDLISLAVFPHLLLVFPTGHLRDRFDRSVVLFGYLLVIGGMVLVALTLDMTVACNPECVRNLFVIWPNGLPEWFWFWLFRIADLVWQPLVLVGVWRHWRVASPAARRALLPLAVAVPVFYGFTASEHLGRAFDVQTLVAFFDGSAGEVIRLLIPLILPLGLLVGIVRTRWSRGRIANLVVELGRGVPLGGLREVLARTLGDPALQLAFAAPSGAGFVDADGQPVHLPPADSAWMVTRLEREGEMLGVLVHDPAIEAEDPGFVEAVGNAARLALENERLAAEVRAQLEEVRASRTRIIEAADAERRRVERDLHDGAQQRLVALAMRLQLAKGATPGASALLDEATTELETAIGEVRGLARGVHPTILTEAGLAAAIDALAERTPLPVAIDVADHRYSQQVEATAYFVVAEALTNIVRYASATEARVSAVEEDGRLVVTVVDDGRGGADPAAGSGLRGLSDRLAAVNGQLNIASPSGGGTTIRAELPLRQSSTRLEDVTVPTAGTSLAMVRAAPQALTTRRAKTGGRLSSPAALIVAVAAAITVIALVAALPSMQQRPSLDGRADGFMRPFVYQVPAGSGIRLYAKSDHLHVLSAPPGDQEGISIWVVDDVLVDHCDWDPMGPPGIVRQREPSVAGLLSYLRSVDHLRIQDAGQAVIDGRAAVRLDLIVEHGGDCQPPSDPHLLLWRDTSPTGTIPMQVPEWTHVPVSILDVDGATVAIEIWSTKSETSIDTWLPTANKIVDSIRFLYRPPPP